MAALKMFHSRQFAAATVRSLLSINRWSEINIKKNDYSVYPPYYVRPVYKKEQQAALKGTEEAEHLAHAPIKAARNNETSSVFHDEFLRQFTNYIMKKGNKILARRLLEKSLENVKRIQLERYHKAEPQDKVGMELDPKIIMHKAIANCKPLLKLERIKRGGATYQVPIPVTDKNAQWVASKWMLEAARDKESNAHLPEKLAYELLDAFNNQGRVIKRKQDLHKQCEANRAYAHYRWS
ncbi:small ribosomal subunit protein uS7m isoform X2 [Neodiprion pinetum]|uniref:28S ribosomal protein S7, mitochondrial isoform X2 n=1 Tax=Neodiprion fabricii TaxID=2872261 RepID=UPI00076FB2DE|nr:28S ribosomal protein S7, mitochondrial isoform X2 [Neodiprion fabricii]XP_046483763.1 28S ribosomal protein S7, mitochondrial isoform X2 [Neodiprion pinetum]XP_046621965.1 28S ribosomal protein S7, mitochondrial isoform X2 [Neodiprion virginianus]